MGKPVNVLLELVNVPQRLSLANVLREESVHARLELANVEIPVVVMEISTTDIKQLMS